jgi:hypothetical protein
VSSIYLSIPSLDDSELLNTISRALNYSGNKHKINIGVSLSLFDNDDIEQYQKSSAGNVKIKILDRDLYKGIGIARRESFSFYDGEDYFLQVDSHMLFMKNWDDLLVHKLSRLKEDKSLLTCYPPEYEYIDFDKPKCLSNWRNIYISKFVSGSLLDRMPHSSFCLSCNKFSAIPLWEEEKVIYLGNEFINNPKLSGGFVFADKRFAEDYLKLLPYNYSFFDDELVMSVEALNLGWKFYSPTDMLPIAHLYSEGINDFGGDRSSLVEEEVMEMNAKNNYINYCLKPNNADKINKFEKHAGIDMIGRAKSEKAKTRTPKENNANFG